MAPPYWVVNLLLDEQIEVHREPRRADVAVDDLV